MEEEFVPYELAVRLKAIDFNEPCLATIDQTEYLHIKGKRRPIRGAMVYNTIDCPTFSQAFRWFREKYGVHSSPRKYDETQWWVEWGTWTSSIGTFEEAEIAWLTKLIEIVENKSE